MREILFRGKRLDNGLWIEGCFRQYLNGRAGICCRKIQHLFLVDPATVGQYTGLKDKNGQRIFEGDIVHMKGGCVSGFGVVEFRNGSFGIADEKRKRFYFLDDHYVCRVEGNIHDNPELLKEDAT